MVISYPWSHLSFESAVSGDGLLLLRPDLFGVVLLMDIVQVAVRIRYPASVDAEAVASHDGLALRLEPLLPASENESQTGLLRQVDADGKLLIVFRDGDDIARLDAGDFLGGELKGIHQVTDVLADDRGWYEDDLVGAGVDLNEALGRGVIRSMADDSPAGAERLLFLLIVLVQLAADETRVENDVGFIFGVAHQLEAGTATDGVAFLVLYPDREDRGEAAAEDIVIYIDGRILDHFLIEPELLEDGVRDFVFIEFVT